eukprot:8388174-Alexandrium_andersonii.AAC.1
MTASGNTTKPTDCHANSESTYATTEFMRLVQQNLHATDRLPIRKSTTHNAHANAYKCNA